ncbi:right-handed parallel beta-helix repeat-containing protein [uncultured Cellulomonas sp.]|uniref:right-handed parallel beta-helix repeat-containing protein n=1 Tax=uncultured Cellulomonas sp. TaxID=189682 RepID=UPI002619F924|nr:right-handed parallel beta-helix repeat-containing protein [uncultured Cellulomonas sp.]
MTGAVTTAGRALVPLGLVLGLVLTGCAPSADVRDAAEVADDGVAAVEPAPVPETVDPSGAPLLSDDGTGTGTGSGSGSGSDQEDTEVDDDDRDDDERGLTAPTAFPDWMTRPTPDGSPCPAGGLRVTDADELRAALDDAGPGTVIQLEPGVYRGEFVTTGSGTADSPARLCGPADAVLDGGGHTGGYVLHLDGAQHWVLSGFTVRNGQKGVMADGTTGTTISGLTVYGTGDEAIHLRRHSTDNLVTGNTISDTGLRKEKFGEGVYVGTAVSNWGEITDGEPDRSDRNRVVGNAVYATTSESVDVKEGTAGGVVSGNQFDGSRITGADSWVDVKGNGWTVADNVGRHTPLDGFQTHDVADGWGTDNVFTGNAGELTVADGVLVALRPENDNRAACDNTLLTDVGGVTDKRCR